MQKIILPLVLALVSCGSEGNSQAQGNGRQGQGQHNGFNGAALVASYEVFDMSDEEKSKLLYMWEEEKLAKDVYLAMLDKWGSRVFSNISGAEQRHMDAVGALLAKYEIKTQVDGAVRGEYSFSELTEAYGAFVAEGLQSERAAFGVGKKIEEMDIADLKSRIETAKPDAKAVYERLLEGSYRHLAAFERQLN